MNQRTPTDGKPYYCALCGCGFGEYLACEMPDCTLESESNAEKRQKPVNRRYALHRRKATVPDTNRSEGDKSLEI